MDLVAAAHASADPWQCHAALRRLEARMSGRCGGADGRTHNGAAMQLLAERVESGASPWFLFDVAALLCRLAAPPRVIEGVPDSSEDVSLDDHVLLASDEGAVGAGRLAAALCTAAAGSHCWHAMERALKAVALLLRVADDGALAGAGAGRVFALRLAARDGLAAALGVDTPLDDPCAAICARRAVKLGVRVSQVLSEGDMLWPVARQRAEQVLHASAAPSSPGGHPPLHGLHRGACVRAALEVLFAAHARGSAGEVDSIAAALSAVCRGLAPSTLARELLYADAALLCSARRACELAQADPALAERMAWTAGAWVAEVLDAVSAARYGGVPCSLVCGALTFAGAG